MSKRKAKTTNPAMAKRKACTTHIYRSSQPPAVHTASASVRSLKVATTTLLVELAACGCKDCKTTARVLVELRDERDSYESTARCGQDLVGRLNGKLTEVVAARKSSKKLLFEMTGKCELYKSILGRQWSMIEKLREHLKYRGALETKQETAPEVADLKSCGGCGEIHLNQDLRDGQLPADKSGTYINTLMRLMLRCVRRA